MFADEGRLCGLNLYGLHSPPGSVPFFVFVVFGGGDVPLKLNRTSGIGVQSASKHDLKQDNSGQQQFTEPILPYTWSVRSQSTGWNSIKKVHLPCHLCRTLW